VSVIVSVAGLLVSGASKAADNAACWDDPTRVEISCTPLTEKLLTSLKFASRRRAIKAMKAEGRPFSPDELQFIGNAKRGDAETGNQRRIGHARCTRRTHQNRLRPILCGNVLLPYYRDHAAQFLRGVTIVEWDFAR
jgi:hypothetical protein